jgi:2-oxoglutarate ferredoxin oxidoreductase subunit alpha
MPDTATPPSAPSAAAASTPRSSVVVRFAGDSGDGMQLAGTQFTDTSAAFGNDVATLPDFPAEIRAPAGTVAGVSGFQINFADQTIYTPGDRVDALIAMNPAAFKAHLADVEPGGIVIVNDTEFTKTNLRKASYEPDQNPLDAEVLTQHYQLYRVPITKLNAESLKDSGLSPKDASRCRNMYALGLVYWLFDRPLENTIAHLNRYFGEKKNLPAVAQANINALKAGYYFGETAEIFQSRFHVEPADIAPGLYRKVTGNEALAAGLIAASKLADKTLVYCSYPITPASDILHHLAPMKHFGVKTFQAEDEIAAVCAAIGAAFGGQLGVTGTSGPGLALKAEAVGLAVMTELPLVVVNVQRGGPSTGLPTKTEQSDLLQAMFGRNGDCPTVVLAPQSPADCFNAAIEAARIAMTHMVPVILLSDGYLANGSEPWRLPDVDSLDPISIAHPEAPEADADPPEAEKRLVSNDDGFHPYRRDDRHVRPWAPPGTPGHMHRIGGLEKQDGTGNVSYDPDNHQRMTQLRQAKVDAVADDIPELALLQGEADDDLLVLGWGGPYGSITTAVKQARDAGLKVAQAHLRHLSPMPRNTAELLGQFRGRILVPELNTGQLRFLINGRYSLDAQGLNKIQGKPFRISEILAAIQQRLA